MVLTKYKYMKILLLAGIYFDFYCHRLRHGADMRDKSLQKEQSKYK